MMLRNEDSSSIEISKEIFKEIRSNLKMENPSKWKEAILLLINLIERKAPSNQE